MTQFPESVVEDATLAWLDVLGSAVLYGPGGVSPCRRLDCRRASAKIDFAVPDNNDWLAFYAGRVIMHPAMANATVVVLTDRNDLESGVGIYLRPHRRPQCRVRSARTRPTRAKTTCFGRSIETLRK